MAYLLPCASDDSYELENAEKGHQEDNSDLKEPDDTHSTQEMDTFLAVESFLHCMIVLELKKEHAAHSWLSGRTILEHLSERILGNFAVEYQHSHVLTLVLLKTH